MYVLDVNVLINAHRNYYPIDQVPEYWEWLLHQAEAGNIKLPKQIHAEIKLDAQNPDALAAWAHTEQAKGVLILQEEMPANLVQQVLVEGYAPDLNDIEVEQIGADPFLIATAMVAPDRIVVTTEVSAITKTRANRRIPDVCDHFGVQHCDPFKLARALGFSTKWKATI